MRNRRTGAGAGMVINRLPAGPDLRIRPIRAELLDRKGPDIPFSIAGAVAMLLTVGSRMRLIENDGASTLSAGKVCVGVIDPNVGPTVTNVAAVEQLRLILLRHGDSAVPPNFGCVIADPHDLKPEHVIQLGHRQVHVEIRQTGQITPTILPSGHRRGGTPSRSYGAP